MLTLPPKAGASVLPPEMYPVLSCRHSGKQSTTSLVLDLPTQPQVNDAGFVFLLNLAGWLAQAPSSHFLFCVSPVALSAL